MNTFVIAEAGSCHDCSPDKMREMICVAKDAGADACKFQWTSSPERLAARRHAEDYLEAYRTIAFPAATLLWLKSLCDAGGIEFMVTVYLPEDIAVVAPLVKRFKIASYEAGDKAFLDAHLAYGKPIIVSTGGMTEAELCRLEFWWNDTHPDQVHLLHCTASYTAPVEDLSLSLIGGTETHYSGLLGLSDHSGHVLTGALAAALGAEIIEVHFRLRSTSPHNPDYGHSLDPEQLRQYVANIRFAEAAMGTPVKRLMPSEERWAKYRVRP